MAGPSVDASASDSPASNVCDAAFGDSDADVDGSIAALQPKQDRGLRVSTQKTCLKTKQK